MRRTGRRQETGRPVAPLEAQKGRRRGVDAEEGLGVAGVTSLEFAGWAVKKAFFYRNRKPWRLRPEVGDASTVPLHRMVLRQSAPKSRVKGPAKCTLQMTDNEGGSRRQTGRPSTCAA